MHRSVVSMQPSRSSKRASPARTASRSGVGRRTAVGGSPPRHAKSQSAGSIISTAELQTMRAHATAPSPLQAEAHRRPVVSAAPGGRRRQASRSKYLMELEQQITENKQRAAEARAEEARADSHASAEAERFDYWGRPRAGGGTPSDPQYLVSRRGAPVHRPLKKGGAVVGGQGNNALRAARSAGRSQVMQAAYHGQERTSSGNVESGERGFFDYFFNPRPGGGTPVRSADGEVVANLKGVLGRPASEVMASSGFPADAAAPTHSASVPALQMSPLQREDAPPVAQKETPPPSPAADVQAVVAERTIADLRRTAAEAVADRDAAEEELASVQAQLQAAISLLEEYRELHGPLPAK